MVPPGILLLFCGGTLQGFHTDTVAEFTQVCHHIKYIYIWIMAMTAWPSAAAVPVRSSSTVRGASAIGATVHLCP